MVTNLFPRRLAEGHECINPLPNHEVHVCRCGTAWNMQGLTFTEWVQYGRPKVPRNTKLRRSLNPSDPKTCIRSQPDAKMNP